MINLKKMWKDTEDSYAGKVGYFFLSPSHYCIYADLLPVLKKHIDGATVVDVGAGRLFWKFVIEKFSKEYFSLDIAINSSKLSIVGDGGLLPIGNEKVDRAISIQVLEHTKDPRSIICEISRVLKKDGKAIISFPHLSYIHGEPEDYQRFTIYGFKNLCEGKLEIIEYCQSGGIICFTMTPFFILMNSLFSKIPFLGKVIYLLSAALSVIIFYADKVFGMRKLYPLNYIAVVRKL